MNFETFQESLNAVAPPASANVYLQSLWYDAKDNWEKAHTLIQDISDKKAAWIHAYLHRKEGDVWNANYWYTKADQRMPGYTFEQEWEEIVKAMV